ncbi:MAG: UDP-N-acetylenolpyruvoylglucosamine reductase [Deltaproteobacteria bacterium]|nr:UDP-N-acetylenolpyruvoylglucosamine reductase [Deltaproteobacteria bacterium]
MTARSQAIQDALAGMDIGKIWYDESMSRHASLKLGGRVDALVIVESEDQLREVIQRLKAGNIPFMPVGNLTNIIVRDGGYRGVMLWMRGLDQAACEPADGGQYYIYAQAGVGLARVVGLAAAEELTGLEFCTGIPGSVGGAVWMNAGAYGTEIKDVISSVTVVDGRGEKKILRREKIAFAYRRSNLPVDVIVCKACFILKKGNEAQIRERMAQIMKWRQEKHPLQYPSAGSVFKNLPGLPAGKLIEELGLKGMRRGDAQVSKQHANFIINKGRGTAQDVLTLITLIQEKARKERGVELETEVMIIGEEL